MSHLEGVRIVVTRARRQGSRLIDRLDVAGAVVIECPAIEIVDASDHGTALRNALARSCSYDWAVFTSVNTVERVGSWQPGATRVAAIGESTAKALSDRGLRVDLVPPEFVAGSLLDVFPAGGGTVLLPQADIARKNLADGLASLGWHVDVIEAYRTIPPVVDEETLSRVAEADAVAFTSSSTVTNYLRLTIGVAVPPVVACIGPVTAHTAREAGLHVDVVASVHTIDGLVDALSEKFAES